MGGGYGRRWRRHIRAAPWAPGQGLAARACHRRRRLCRCLLLLQPLLLPQRLLPRGLQLLLLLLLLLMLLLPLH